ncbi:hypothetical protein GCM10010340_52410 [Streptomyces griseoloalbus]|nr:hypothetical protein GCM10010294_65960 [Streptomyces griseoloalbus]GGW67635.1 hypothetical protein GCM10010340_52410 [Streptomyces albaduncus]
MCLPRRVGSSPLAVPWNAGQDIAVVQEKHRSNGYAPGGVPEYSGNGRPLREGHSGVWRSDAGHEHARERRTVPE